MTTAKQKAEHRINRTASKVKYLIQDAHDMAHSAICDLRELEGWDPAGSATPELIEAEDLMKKARALLRKAGAKEEV